ncbi:MAG: SGNH/GDSL hydrolase family protein [Candidatus Ornithomonoglobus sp.]
MNRRFIALLSAVSVMGTMLSAVPATVTAAEQDTYIAVAEETESSIITLFAPDGEEGYGRFEAYSSENGTVTPHSGWVDFQQNDGYGWNAANGIKVNVTDELKNAQSGGEFEVSFKFTSYYWGGENVSVYFETADGEKTALTTTTEIGENGTEQEVAASGTYTFGDDDTVYLCITHSSGTQSYSYFSLSGTMKGAEIVTAPPESGETETLFAPGDLDGYSRFEVYSADNGTVTPHSGWVDFQQNDGYGWNAANGIKVDVTEELKNAQSGALFKVSFKFTSYYWGNTNVSVFFETADGVKTALKTTTELGENGTAQEVAASGAFSFSEEDTVYLCITHSSGTHSYSYFTLSCGDGAQIPTTAPDATEEPDGDKVPLLSKTFDSRDELAGFMAYDASASEEYELQADNGYLTVTFNGSDWNASNGIKYNITYLVKGRSGGTFGASADFFSYYFGTADAELFFEVIKPDGTKTQTDIASGAAENGQYTTMKGETALSFEDDDTVYLCVTHSSGTHRYDNISLYYCGTLETTPIFTDDFSTAEQADLYASYDSEIPVTKTVESNSLKFEFDNGDQNWSKSNGFRREITDDVKGLSGSYTLYASMSFRCWYYGEANMFFEVLTENGAVRSKTPIATGKGENGDTIELSGKARIYFDDTDRVYLCATEDAGTHIYSNVKLSYRKWYGGAIEGPLPVVPSGATAFFVHGFSSALKDSQAAAYSAYGEGSVAGGLTQTLKFTADAEAETNGIKTDVTSYVRNGASGDTFGAALIMKAFNSDAAASMFIEVTDETGAVKKTYPLASSDGAELTDGTYYMGTGWLASPLIGEAGIEFGQSDRIYLCVTQPAATQLYDDIYFWGKLSAPSGAGLTAFTPELTESGAQVVISNRTNKDAAASILTVKYENGIPSSVKLKTAELAANTINEAVEFEAEAGDTVYIWDGSQKPLIGKTVLENTETAMIGTWSAAQMDVFDSSLRQETIDLSNKTIRQKVRLTTGGEKLTVEFSNQFGYGPLEIKAANAAIPGEGSVIQLDTDTPITFGGETSVVIPKGETVISDPVYIKTGDLSDLDITISVGEVPYSTTYNQWSTGLTCHAGARSTTYVQEGASVSSQSMTLGETITAWVFLAGINVLAPAENEAVVCFGDSITDGVGSTTDANNRWTDVFAQLCKASDSTRNISVLNMGIGGNAVVSGSVGPMATERFERDVLNQQGVKYMVLLEGINDIGKESAISANPSYAEQIKAAYSDFIEKAHEKGIKVYGGTILPCGNYTTYYSETEEALREEINTWILSSESGFDGVIDFASAMEDPSKPGYLNTTYDCGDGLHPNPTGYELMGTMVYNTIFSE